MSEATEIRVRGYHLDVYGHVNNARYLEFLEEARWDLFEKKIDLEDWKNRNLAFFVANINIDYRRPASLGDILVIRSGIFRFGTKSAVIRQRIDSKKSGKRIAEARITFVLADIETGRAVPLEGKLRSLLKGLFGEEPEDDIRN